MESKQNTKLEQAKEVVRLVMDEDYSIEEALKKVKKQNHPAKGNTMNYISKIFKVVICLKMTKKLMMYW